MMEHSLLKSKTFCVIVGASQGYGRTIAVTLAGLLGENSTLLLLSRNIAKLAEVEAEILSKCKTIKIVHAAYDLEDIRKYNAETFKKIVNESGVDVASFETAMVIHNSSMLGDVTKFTWELSDVDSVNSVMTVNITGAILLNAAFLELVRNAGVKTKVVINVSSLSAIQPFSSWSLYCTSKAARDMYFQTVAKEDPSLRVLNWAPGPMDTDMQLLCRQCADKELSKIFHDMHVQKKLLTCEESVSKLVKLLEANSFQSGQHIDFYDV